MESQVLIYKTPTVEMTFHREPMSLKDRGEHMRRGPFIRRVDSTGRVWSTPPLTTYQDDWNYVSMP